MKSLIYQYLYIDIFRRNEAAVISVEICLGSSCYSRGNRRTLELLEEYIDSEKLTKKVSLRGRLCLDYCSCGPHIVLDGDRIDLVAPEGVLDVLEQKLAVNK